jgi:general secretion pathway protein H
MRRERGFTLIELLIVLVIIGVALAFVAVSGVSNPQRALRFEAEKLAQLLTLAREEAQVRGAAIRFDANAQGYGFLEVKERQWQDISDDDDLRRRNWEQPTKWRLTRQDSKPVVEFGRDAVDSPFVVELIRDSGTVTIKANGLGSFLVD